MLADELAEALGVEPDEKPLRHYRKWTTEEDTFLASSIGKLGYRATARELKRSVGAIRERASMLGVKRGIPGGRPAMWTKRQDDLLTQYIAKLSSAIGKPQSAVISRLHKLHRLGGANGSSNRTQTARRTRRDAEAAKAVRARPADTRRRS